LGSWALETHGFINVSLAKKLKAHPSQFDTRQIENLNTHTFLKPMKAQLKTVEKPKTQIAEIEEIRETVMPAGRVRNLAD